LERAGSVPSLLGPALWLRPPSVAVFSSPPLRHPPPHAPTPRVAPNPPPAESNSRAAAVFYSP
jgi:hypothetical protein